MTQNVKQLRPQKYTDERPPEYFMPYHHRARTKSPLWVYHLFWLVLVPVTRYFYRLKAYNRHLVPEGVPVILAPNHHSNYDHFTAPATLARRVRFVAKSRMFRFPLQWTISHGGVIPARRGVADFEMFKSVLTVLRKNETAVVYINGGRNRQPGTKPDPVWGVGYLALKSGACVVPVYISGTEHIRSWKPWPPSKWRKPEQLHVVFGRPMYFEHVVGEPSKEQCWKVAHEINDEVIAIGKQYESKRRTNAAIITWATPAEQKAA
jgi:1-acyl-sn-glycerol-3-phosphate acyltransferase